MGIRSKITLYLLYFANASSMMHGYVHGYGSTMYVRWLSSQRFFYAFLPFFCLVSVHREVQKKEEE